MFPTSSIFNEEIPIGCKRRTIRQNRGSVDCIREISISCNNNRILASYVLENLVPCLTISSTASKESPSDATFRRARAANIPAFIQQVLSQHSQEERIITCLHCNGSQLCSSHVGAESRNEIKSNVALHTCTSSTVNQLGRLKKLMRTS